MTTPNCFTNIIGITRNPCECLEPYLPEGYTESTSGLYMDELPQAPFNLAIIQSISSECDKDLATRLTNARQQAYDDFKKDLFQQLQARFQSKFKSFAGNIGSTSGTSYLTPGGSKVALVINAKKNRGVTITVRKVYTNFSASGTLAVKVYKQQGNVLDETPLYEFDLLVSNTSATTDLTSLGIKLPATDESGKELKYYFVYDNIGSNPRNFSNSCGCGDKEATMKTYMTSNAVNAGSLQDLVSAARTPYLNGLNLEVTIDCGNDDIICQAMEQNEFIKVTIESCIQRKSVVNLLNQVLHSTVINRYTQANREQMFYDASNLNKKYINDVQWVAENMSMSLNDCFVCQTVNQPMYMTGILV